MSISETRSIQLALLIVTSAVCSNASPSQKRATSSSRLTGCSQDSPKSVMSLAQGFRDCGLHYEYDARTGDTILSANRKGSEIDLRSAASLIRSTAGRFELNLSGAAISSVEPLRGLSELTSLDLTGVNAQDFSVLSTLSGLERLSLSRTSFTDFQSLRSLSHLSFLDMSGARPTNVDGINYLPRLRWLVLDDMPNLRNLKGLRGSQSISVISAQGTKRLTNLEGLSYLPNLYSMSLSNSGILALRGMRELPSLAFLDLSSTRIQSLTPDGEFNRLEELSLLDTPELRSLKNLIAFPNLHRLNVSRARKLTNLLGVGRLRMLSALSIVDSSVTEISDVKGCFSLRSLILAKCPLREVTSLSALPQLECLILESTRVFDLTPVEPMQHLVYLSLTATPVSDISCLSGLLSLTDLNLSKCKVRSVAPLVKLRHLKRLDLSGTHVNDYDLLESPGLRLTLRTSR